MKETNFKISGSKRLIYIFGFSVVLVLSLIINGIGLQWGRTGLVPWQADSIEGITTVRELPRLFGSWKYKYPRGQFLINGIFYKPLLKHWKKHPVYVQASDGRMVPSTLTLSRLDELAKISRLISMFMGTATVLLVLLTARLLFADYLASLFAALAMALSQLFVFYSHLGNVDVPSVFWFAFGTYMAVKAVFIGRWRHFALMGFCFSFSICTKDAMAGYLLGMLPAFLFLIQAKAKTEGRSFKVFMCFSWKKLLVAIIVFLFVYALLQDILTCPKDFFERMSVWLGGRGVADYNTNFTGQLPLLRDALVMLYSSLGWPLLTAIAASMVYMFIKEPWRAAFAVAPVIVFYIIIVTNIRMVQPRYFLPAYCGFALLAGRGLSVLLRSPKIPVLLRIFAVVLVYTLSFLYCIGLDLELINDPRRRAEQWFVANISRDVPVAAVVRKIIYAPRLDTLGFKYLCPWQPPEEHPPNNPLKLPKYIIINNDMFGSDFKNTLRNGSHPNYKPVTSYRCKYLYPPEHTIFSLAGWPCKKTSWLNTEIIIFEKN